MWHIKINIVYSYANNRLTNEIFTIWIDFTVSYNRIAEYPNIFA